MRKTYDGIVLVAAVLFLCGSLMAQQPITVPGGTPIKLRLAETLQCEDSHPGDSIGFEVIDDIKIDGVIVIPHGALAYGRVLEPTTWARRSGRGGKIYLTLVSVTDATGRQIPITEERYRQARGLGTEITVAMVSAPNPLWFLALGKHTEFRDGKMFIAVTAHEAKVNRSNLDRNLALNAPTPVPETPTKTDMPLKPQTPQFQNVAYPKSYNLTSAGTLTASR